MLSVEDWAEIRRLHRREGLGIKTIARTVGVSRNTVRAAIASDGPPKYERNPVGSAVDAFEDAIRAQLELVPTMPATVIAERVGWTRGITVFSASCRCSCVGFSRCYSQSEHAGADHVGANVRWRADDVHAHPDPPPPPRHDHLGRQGYRSSRNGSTGERRMSSRCSYSRQTGRSC